MKIEKEICMYCGACATVCHLNCILVENYNIYIGPECNDCKICIKACPAEAISDES